MFARLARNRGHADQQALGCLLPQRRDFFNEGEARFAQIGGRGARRRAGVSTSPKRQKREKPQSPTPDRLGAKSTIRN